MPKAFTTPGQIPDLLDKSRLQLQEKNGHTVYVVDLDWQELGFTAEEITAGLRLGFSVLVNSNHGKGRYGILYWGEGIAVSKQPSEYNQLILADD